MVASAPMRERAKIARRRPGPQGPGRRFASAGRRRGARRRRAARRGGGGLRPRRARRSRRFPRAVLARHHRPAPGPRRPRPAASAPRRGAAARSCSRPGTTSAPPRRRWSAGTRRRTPTAARWRCARTRWRRAATYAIVLAVLGRIDEAEAEHRRLADDPATRLWALTRLALMRPAAITDAELGEMRARPTGASIDLDTRIGLWFALGEALERRGADDAAFDAFAARQPAEARRSWRRARRRNRPRCSRLHAESARRVRARVRGRRPRRAAAARRPFDRRADLRGRHAALRLDADRADPLSPPATCARWARPPCCRSCWSGGRGFGAARPTRPRRGARRASTWRRSARRGWRGAGRFVDKTLENYLHVGAIALMFPRAVILHAVRDPVDTCLSCWRQLFAQRRRDALRPRRDRRRVRRLSRRRWTTGAPCCPAG